MTLKVPLAEEEQDPHNQFMQQVINIIEANLTNESFNVKYLASSLNMSQPTLYRRIKENSQQSIIELIRNVRISKAASLLLLKNTRYKRSPKWWDTMTMIRSENVLSSSLTFLHQSISKSHKTISSSKIIFIIDKEHKLPIKHLYLFELL